MKITIKIFALIILLTSSITYGQESNQCDTIYDNVDKMPQFNKDRVGLSDYLTNELVPIISNCMQRDSSLIASLQIILIIDKNGKVIDANFTRPKLTERCKLELKNKLITMTGWTSGQLKGQNVCSRFYWPISCLYWQ